VEDERDLEVDAVGGDLAAFDRDLLARDPALRMSCTVSAAFTIARRTASSKLSVDSDVISITFATEVATRSSSNVDMTPPFVEGTLGCAGTPCIRAGTHAHPGELPSRRGVARFGEGGCELRALERLALEQKPLEAGEVGAALGQHRGSPLLGLLDHAPGLGVGLSRHPG
jgi:hypothetical protein